MGAHLSTKKIPSAQPGKLLQSWPETEIEFFFMARGGGGFLQLMQLMGLAMSIVT